MPLDSADGGEGAGAAAGGEARAGTAAGVTTETGAAGGDATAAGAGAGAGTAAGAGVAAVPWDEAGAGTELTAALERSREAFVSIGCTESAVVAAGGLLSCAGDLLRRAGCSTAGQGFGSLPINLGEGREIQLRRELGTTWMVRTINFSFHR